MNEKQRNSLLKKPSVLRDHIRRSLKSSNWHSRIVTLDTDELKQASVVLFIISQSASRATNGSSEPCIILNKRSVKVPQAGDLCCSGGGLNWLIDKLLSKFLRIPGAPLGSPQIWEDVKTERHIWQKKLRSTLPILLAAGLREAWEEMRLNPLHFEFLGMLPKQHLAMFKRVIYPIVGWAPPQQYKPNWEVERIVSVALRDLLNPARYGRFQPVMANGNTDSDPSLQSNSFPCYIHDGRRGSEFLWGATYNITQNFLKLVFNFDSPENDSLPIIRRQLDETYLNGSR